MRFIANPVEVEANEIVSVGAAMPEGRHLALRNGENVLATPEMLSRIMPIPGDFWVVQADGYAYLNPKQVFLRKYHPAPQSTVEENPVPVHAG